MDPTVQILYVCSPDSPEFTQLSSALAHSTLVGLDAEWKPFPRNHRQRQRHHQPTSPAVSLLQIACRLSSAVLVFLLDLQQLPLPEIYELLKELLVSPNCLKLGFTFKLDLLYLSSTFRSQGCGDGFERVEPFMDVGSIYNYLQHGRKNRPKQRYGLAAICQEVLGVSLSKELQCSDWTERPLSEDQKKYAAMDVECLLQIFSVFQSKIETEGVSSYWLTAGNLGLKQIPELLKGCRMVLRRDACSASNVVRTIMYDCPGFSPVTKSEACEKWNGINKEMDDVILYIVMKYGDKISLKDSDKKKKKSSDGVTRKEKVPPPWDSSLGGDGCPKFLCDMMTEGLAKHLRCIGIDAAVPHSRKPETRDLIEQAHKERRVLLTRDSKILTQYSFIINLIYLVKEHVKNEQLLEVIETFKLNIRVDQLMLRCINCNGECIQKPLTAEEAVKATKGFQAIPNCLSSRDIKFWQCMDCRQLFWEGKHTMQCNSLCKVN